MLEIIFTDGRIGAGAVKVVGVAEKTRINASALSKEDNALLRQFSAQNKFEGQVGRFAEVWGTNGKIIAAGLGAKPDALSLRRAGAALAQRLFKDEVAVFYVEPLKECKLSEEEIAHNLALGLLLGSYRFDKYFTTKKAEEYPNLERVVFKVRNPAEVNENFKNLAALANAVRYARDLCNEPANYLTPEVFAADIERLKYLGLEIEILGRRELEEKGFGLLLAVAQGSVQEPKVAVIKWKGNPDSDKWDVGLVGKGVTFDSGGISLKPDAGMEDMKQDMTGAAVVAASLKALALQAAKVNVIGIVGLVENMPGAEAMKLGDVYTSLSGQTVEIRHTNAEGRLVLADLMSYLQQNFGISRMIDVATLGAVKHLFGKGYAGLFASDAGLEKELLAAAEQSGEKIWPLPMDDFYDKMLKSEMADMSNDYERAGSSMAAVMFLKRFVQKDLPWAHLDISGMRADDKGMATGFGVRLLNEFIAKEW